MRPLGAVHGRVEEPVGREIVDERRGAAQERLVLDAEQPLADRHAVGAASRSRYSRTAATMLW